MYLYVYDGVTHICIHTYMHTPNLITIDLKLNVKKY